MSTLLILLSAPAWMPGQQPQTTEVQLKARYDELVKRVKAGDKSVDFVQLISAASDLDLALAQSNEAPRRREMVETFRRRIIRPLLNSPRPFLITNSQTGDCIAQLKTLVDNWERFPEQTFIGTLQIHFSKRFLALVMARRSRQLIACNRSMKST